jgi:outer membrane protein assembly factor BamA
VPAAPHFHIGRPLASLLTSLLVLASACPDRARGVPRSRPRPTVPTEDDEQLPLAYWQGRRVTAIRFEGLKRTRHSRLRQLLNTKVGNRFDVEVWRHDLRRVRNLELYRNPRARFARDGEGVAITVALEDKWSLLPFFNAFFNLSSVNVITGIYDVNLAGSLCYLDLDLLIFSYLPIKKETVRPGGIVTFSWPRLAGLPLAWYVDLRAQTTVNTVWGERARPAAYFQLDYYGGFHYLEWEPKQWLRLALRHTLGWMRFRQAEGMPVSALPTPETGWTHELAMELSLGYLKYRNYMMHGIRLDLSLDTAPRELGTSQPYSRLWGTARAYYRFGPRGGNLAARVGAGYAKGGGFGNLFHIGSFTGLRGFVTNQFNVRSYVYGNLEYRSGLLPLEFPIAAIVPYFKGKVLRLQGTAFVDVGGVAGGGPWRTRESGEPLVSVGAGLRAMVVNLYRAVLRIDFAYTLAPYRSYDLIVATQQFF